MGENETAQAEKEIERQAGMPDAQARDVDRFEEMERHDQDGRHAPQSIQDFIATVHGEDPMCIA
jgi:hypothetical protein